MKKFKYLYQFLTGIFCVSMFSCIEDIEFKGTITDPLIVVNGLAMKDSVFTAHITKSRFFLENSDGSFEPITNADASLMVNGLFLEKLTYSNGIYVSDYYPQIGDKIRLEVSASGFENVYSEIVVCDYPEVEKVDTTSSYVDESTVYDGYGSGYIIGKTTTRDYKFRLYIDDPANEQNFYKIRITRMFTYDDGHTELYNSQYYYDDDSAEDVVVYEDIVFSDGEVNVDGYNYNEYNIFTDAIFDGTVYGLKFSVKASTFEYNSIPSESPKVVSSQIRIYLEQINKDLYLYYKSLNMYSNFDDFFSEPVQIHNNIKNGIGILGSSTTREIIIELQ